MSAAKMTNVLVGEEVVAKLREMWINGFMSGAATAAEAIGAAPDLAERLGQQLVEKLYSDPLAILAVDAEVKETLIGLDSGEKSFTIKGTDA